MSLVEQQMWFDVWAADDLLGDAIGTLSQGSNRMFRSVDDGIGEGSFSINRNDSEFASLCATDNLIRVRVVTGGPFAYDDERYIGAFFIERGEDVIVSPDEEGGEVVTLSGQSAEAILRRAVIDYVAHFSTNITPWSGVPSFASTAAADGQWHINSSDHPGSEVGTPGGVMRVFLRDATAQTPEPISEVTHDFSTEHDSVGTDWVNGLTDWSFDVGTDLLTILGILIAAGLHYRFRPSLLMQAYEDPVGTNVSGSVSFVKGVNVRDAGTRAIEASQAKTRVLVRGSRRAGGYTYHWSADTGLEATPLGIRQGFLDYQAASGAVDGDNVLGRAGLKFIATGKHQHDGPPTIGAINTTGMVAFEDYLPGDTVGVDLPEFADPTRIHAITLVENGDTGVVDPTIEFVDEGSPELASQSGTSAITRVEDPFFVDVPDTDPTTPFEMQMRDDGGTDDYYSIMHAARADPPTVDAQLELDTSFGANLFSYSESGDVYALGQFDGVLGSIYLDASTGFEVDVDGTEFNSKHYLVGGWGLVLPLLASDPSGGNSEEGQCYYNSAAEVIRCYDGSAWSTVGDLSGLTPDVSALTAAVFGVQAHGSTGSAETFDVTAAGLHTATLDAATVTCTFTSPPTATDYQMAIAFTQDGTGGRAIDLPASVVNGSAIEAALDGTAGATTLMVFVTWDGGTNWIGSVVGGASGGGGSSSSVIASAESNSPATTHATPNTITTLLFDTFYDVDQSPASFPAGLGLTYSAGVFTATEDGAWTVQIEVDLAASPGSAGQVLFHGGGFASGPRFFPAASGNPSVSTATRIVYLRSGDSFHMEQESVGSSIQLVDYIALDIVRVASAIS